MSRTPPRVKRLLRGSFTSDQPVLGWRHFHVLSLRQGADGWEAELAASCDAARRLWVPTSQLLRQEGWKAGWTLLREL